MLHSLLRAAWPHPFSKVQRRQTSTRGMDEATEDAGWSTTDLTTFEKTQSLLKVKRQNLILILYRLKLLSYSLVLRTGKNSSCRYWAECYLECLPKKKSHHLTTLHLSHWSVCNCLNKYPQIYSNQQIVVPLMVKFMSELQYFMRCRT